MPDTPSPDELKDLTRPKLDKVAAKAGVPNPDALPNKDAVISAIEAPNPALAPEPPPPRSEQTYTVCGPVPVYDTRPGETFSRLLTAEQEQHLVDAGHITLETDGGEN